MKNKKLLVILLILIVGLLVFGAWKYFESTNPLETTDTAKNTEQVENTEPIDIGNPQKGDFVKVGKMSEPRYNHEAILLDDGSVLVFGGGEDNAEVYNPITRKFKVIGTSISADNSYTTTLLKNGEILIVGYHKEAKIFDPKTNTLKLSGNMNYPRLNHTAILLNDGRVLIIGGTLIDPTKGYNYQKFKLVEKSEIYNPETNKFTIAAKMNIPRAEHSTILLKDGRVLVVGGFKKNEILTGAEIYNPKRNKYELAGNMNIARQKANIYLLKNGNILISGGIGERDKNGGLDSILRREIEIYNPKTNKFKIVAKRDSIPEHPAEVLLANDKILFTGGSSGVGLSLTYFKSSEIYDPETNKFIKGKDMNLFRAGHVMTLLKDGNVLITGSDGKGKTAELYISK